MSSGSIPLLSQTQKFDSAATALTLAQRDGSAGLAVAALAASQVTCSGSVSTAWNAQTASYNILWGAGKDHKIEVDSTGGNVTLTLPAPATVGAGGELEVIRKVAANVVSLAQNATEKINGTASGKTIPATANLICLIRCNGTDWYVGTLTVI